MFDLYILVTSFLALIAILTLINLKLTLKQPITHLIHATNDNQHKLTQPQTLQSTQNNNISNSSILKTLLYLIKNFTFLELIIVRRPKNKVPIFLSLMIQLTLIYFLDLAFYFSAIGILITITFFIVKLVSDRLQTTQPNSPEHQNKNQKNQVENHCKLQIFMTTLSLLINMTLCWIFYKNFNNQLLMKNSINLGIIFAIDNFAVKPFALALISLPLSFSDHVIQFIEKENQIVEMLHQNRIRKTKKRINEKVKNPQRVFVSTSQTENTLQIEPYVNLDPHQKVLQTINPRRKIELQKIIPARKRPSKQYNGDNSSLSLFDQHLPLKQPFQMIKNAQNFKSLQKNLDTSPQVKQNIDEINNTSFFKKKNNIYTQNVDFIDESKIPEENKKRNENLENQDPLKNLEIKTPKTVKFLKEIKFTNSAKKAFEKSNEDHSGRKNQFSKNQSQISQKTQEFNDQNRSNRSHGSNFYGSAGKNDLLKIYEDKFAQDLGQIDANSPYRKRRNPLESRINEMNSKQNQTNISKKFSLDPQKNMKTSHFPDYLQKTYLQESLEKKRRSFHHVSDLNLSRKSDAFSKHSNDSRISKSFKRTVRTKDPIVRENDENRIPEFIIEDFTY